MPEHYFTHQPGAAHRPGVVQVVLPGLHLRLETDSGMFSPGRLDTGTRVLLHAGLRNVRAVTPDEVPAATLFAAIWTNPPVRIGKAALHDLLARWLARLTPDGSAYLVAQRHLGADSLQRWLAGEGFEVSRITSRAGYRVVRVNDPKRLPRNGDHASELAR